MKVTKLIAFLVLLILSSNTTYATHVGGSEIYYEHITDSTYDFYVKLYRECNGIKMTLDSTMVTMICTTSNIKTGISMTRSYIKEITTKCTAAANLCSPLDSSYSGSGIEEVLYKARIDFSNSRFKAFAACGDLEVQVKISARPSYLGSSSYHFNYLRTNLNKFSSNSSPSFTSTPINRVNVSTPTYLHFGATDKDGDSLSYHTAIPLKERNTDARYSGTYSKDKPLEVYYPGSSTKTDPNSPWFPAGYYFDNLSGLAIFTPTKSSESALIKVEVKEWRKTTSGTYEQVGSTFREILLHVGMFSPNYPPNFNGWSSPADIAAGDTFRHVFKSQDRRAPGQTALDTTVFSWDSAISGMTFKNIVDTSSSRSAEMIWVPRASDIRNEPYIATLFITDNNCPLPARLARTCSFKVHQNLKNIGAKLTVKTENCRLYEYKAKFDSMPINYSKMVWKVYDTLGNILPKQGNFNFYPSKIGQPDSVYGDSLIIAFQRAGVFVIEFTIRNAAGEVKLYDTVMDIRYPQMIVPTDSIVCENDSVRMEPFQPDRGYFSDWSWIWQGDTLSNEHIKFEVDNGSEFLYALAMGIDGCIKMDSVQFRVRYSPSLAFIKDTVHCSLQPLLTYGYDIKDSGLVTNKFLWSTGSTMSSTSIDTSGTVWVVVMNSCGKDSTGFLAVIDTPFQYTLGTDKFLCDTNQTVLGMELRDRTSYLWNTGDQTNKLTVSKSGVYTVTVQTPCYNISDTIEVSFDRSPSPLNWEEYILYCDTIDDLFDAGNSGHTYLWDDSTTGQTKIINRPGWHKVTVTSKHCGSLSDSSYAVFIKTPNVQLGNDTSVQKPVSIILDAGDHTNAQYLWSTGDTVREININDFGTYWVKVTNVCGTGYDTINVFDKSNISRVYNGAISLRPNPTAGTFVLSGFESDIREIQIFDAMGIRVHFTITQHTKEVELNMTNPAAGFYFVVVHNGSNTIAVPFLVK